ncbi:MAG: hypothetical protein ACLFV7_03600, partial [Phycisphaerae bacterium]
MKKQAMFMLPWVLTLAILGGAGLAMAQEDAAEDGKSSKSIDSGEIASKAEFQQRRFKNLITDMVKLANLVESTDPES